MKPGNKLRLYIIAVVCKAGAFNGIVQYPGGIGLPPKGTASGSLFYE